MTPQNPPPQVWPPRQPWLCGNDARDPSGVQSCAQSHPPTRPGTPQCQRWQGIGHPTGEHMRVREVVR